MNIKHKKMKMFMLLNIELEELKMREFVSVVALTVMFSLLGTSAIYAQTTNERTIETITVYNDYTEIVLTSNFSTAPYDCDGNFNWSYNKVYLDNDANYEHFLATVLTAHGTSKNIEFTFSQCFTSDGVKANTVTIYQ